MLNVGKSVLNHSQMTKLTSINRAHSKGSFYIRALAISQDRETILLEPSKCINVKKRKSLIFVTVRIKTTHSLALITHTVNQHQKHQIPSKTETSDVSATK